MESFFSSLKTERTARKIIFSYIERFNNAIRHRSMIGCHPVEFERKVGLD